MKNLKEIHNVTQQLDVLECSCTVRGRQCLSLFPRKEAFAPMWKTLEQKNPGGVTLEVIANNAICPTHARILGRVRTDIVRLDEVVDKLYEPVRKARQEKLERQRSIEALQRRREPGRIAHTPVFGEKLKQALQK
jgi:hypothetical protein